MTAYIFPLSISTIDYILPSFLSGKRSYLMIFFIHRIHIIFTLNYWFLTRWDYNDRTYSLTIFCMILKNKSSLLLGSILLIGAMVFGDTSFWQYGYGEDSPGNSVSRHESKQIVAKSDKDNKKEKEKNKTALQNKKSNEDKNKDKKEREEKEKRNNMLRFWKPALRTGDRDIIDGKINRVPQWERLDFLLRVIGKIAKLENNISNSNMLPERKEKYLDMLEAIRILVQERIDGLTGSGAVVDVTPPVVSAFTASGISMNSATFTTTVNESSIWYYVLLASGSTAPTAAQVKLGQDSSGSLVPLRGSVLLTSGTNTFSVTSLTAVQTYVIYFAVADLKWNLQTAAFSLTFMTTNIPDVTPPVLSSLTLSGVTSTGTNLSFTSTEAGKWYYVLLASGSTAPTAAQVKLWQDAASGSVILASSGTVASGLNTFTITGLTSNTSYVLYLVAEDLSGNLSISVMSTPLTTLIVDITPPVITALSATGITSSGATVSVDVSESGTGYYVVLSNGSSTPTAAQIKLWQDATSVVASIKGSLATTTGTNSFSLTSLSPSSAFIIFFTAEDASGNLQDVVQVVSFSTLSSL